MTTPETTMSELGAVNPVFAKGEARLQSIRHDHNIISTTLSKKLFSALEEYWAGHRVLVEDWEKSIADINLQDPEAGSVLSSDPHYWIPPAHERTVHQRGTMIHWYPDPTRLARSFGGIGQVSQYPLPEEQVSGLNCVTCIHVMTWLTHLTTEPKQYF
jgi:hypothetical protein